MTTLTNHTSAGPRTTQPGWPEILSGSAAYAACFALVAVFLPLIGDDGVAGGVGLVVSGLMGLIALTVAALIRIRGLSAFGLRRASARQLLVGGALGLVAFILGSIAAIMFTSLNGDVENVQSTYQASAAGGLLSVVVTFVAGSIITPIGEEAFFRGVIANSLLARYGSWVGVIASAAIFAAAHGINAVMVTAFIVGILTAILFRRSDSIWPGVMLHGVNNAMALFLPVILAAVMSA